MPAFRTSAAARGPLRTLCLATFLSLSIAGCTEDAGTARKAGSADADTVLTTADTLKTAKDTLLVDTASSASKNSPLVQPDRNMAAAHTYYFIRPKDSAGKAFLKTLTPEQLQIVYALNRVDPGPARRTDTLVIPDKWEIDLLAYSPYPAEVPALAGVKKIIFFSYPIQAFGVYEMGRLVRWGPTSMGKKSTPTPTGLFFSNWKSKEAISTVDPSWKLKWNFNVSNKGGVGWHQYAMPGYPASHSCMRLYDHDAAWLYTWADQWRLTPDGGSLVLKGTPCVIFGSYPWGQLKPWRRLVANGDDNNISPEALAAEVQPFMEKIMEAQAARDAAPVLSKNTGVDSNRTAAPIIP